MPLHIPATFRDIPSKIEGVIPEHWNVRYVYYNKIIIIIIIIIIIVIIIITFIIMCAMAGKTGDIDGDDVMQRWQ